MLNNNINPGQGAASVESFEVDLNALENIAGPASEGEGGVKKPIGAGEARPIFEIDERFKGLPPEEARLRTIQSRYDLTVQERDRIAASLAELEPYRNFVNQVMSDEKMAIALMNKINPNLVPKKDMGQVIKARLKEQFGEGFKPQLSREEAERDDPGGKDWQYYRSLDKITSEATNDDPQHGLTIEQYKQKMDAMRAEEDKAALKEIEDVKKEFNASDQEVRAVSEFLNKLSFKEGFKMHRFLRRFNSKTSGIAGISGGSPSVLSDRQKFIQDFNNSK